MSVSALDRFRSVLVRVDTNAEEFKAEKKKRASIYADTLRVPKRDIEAYDDLIQGYERFDETKKYFLYRKAKTFDKLYEDRIWQLFVALGASVVNKNNSTLILNETGKTKQFDVIAKIENTIFFVECKSAEEPGSRALKKDLAETHTNRKDLVRLCKSNWGEDSVRIALIYAVDKIRMSEGDLADADTWKIKVWDSATVSYFEDLADRLGDAAKYQVFAEIFEDQEIDNFSPKVPTIKHVAGKRTFYYFLVRPADLLKIAYIHHRKLKLADYENPYQRMVNKKRIEDIRGFIKTGGFFPNDVIVNFRKSPLFQSTGTIEGIQFGTMTLPQYYKSAWIVDGQHRLFGYTNTLEARSEVIPVFAFEGLPEDEQGEIFIEINENQRSVESNLLWDLYGDIFYESTDEDKRLLVTISLIGKELNTSKKSPFHDHIYVPSMNDKSESANVTLQAICNRLLKGSFIKRKKQPGDLFKENYEVTIEFASNRIIEFFDILKNANIEDWNRGEAGLSRSNVGVNVFLIVFQEILKTFRTQEENPVFSDPEFSTQVRHLLGPVTKMLKEIDQRQIAQFKQLLGEKGFVENARKICKLIHDEIRGFAPEILSEEIEENVPIITNPNQLINTVEVEIRKTIHTVLLNKFGPTYWDSGIVIPIDVKTTVATKIDDELKKYPYKTSQDYASGEKKIQFCDIMDYSKIMICKNNWELFEPLFRVREQVDERFRHLNEYRKRIMHGRTDAEIDDVVQKNGEATIIWLSKVLGIES